MSTCLLRLMIERKIWNAPRINVAFVSTSAPSSQTALRREIYTRRSGNLTGISSTVATVVEEELMENLRIIEQTLVKKEEVEQMHFKNVLGNLQDELQTTQDLHLSTVRREVESLKSDLDKMRSNLKYESEKILAGQRLDLNLEKGYIQESLSTQKVEQRAFENKLTDDFQGLMDQLAENKATVITYCIGVMMTVSVVGLGLFRIAL